MIGTLFLVSVFFTTLPSTTAWTITRGTTWCGAGNISSSIGSLRGSYTSIDRCCRDHDACPHSIHALTSKYNYYNTRFFTISSCECDEHFRICLKNAGSHGQMLVKRKATSIGRIFFNNRAAACFQLEEVRTCHDPLPHNSSTCSNVTLQQNVKRIRSPRHF